nr:hypothetical protein [Aphis gossypii nege-like virus]
MWKVTIHLCSHLLLICLRRKIFPSSSLVAKVTFTMNVRTSSMLRIELNLSCALIKINMYSLVFFIVLLSTVNSGIIKQNFLEQLTPSDRNLFYSKLVRNSVFDHKYTGTPSKFEFDDNCLAFVKTNSLFFKGCELPSTCGHVRSKKIYSNFFGTEVLFCFSFHKKLRFEHSYEFHDLSVNSFDMVLSQSYQPDGEPIRDDLKSVNIVSFFQHFWFVTTKDSPKIGLLPKICDDHYTFGDDILPDSVVLSHHDYKSCVHHQSIDNVCNVVWLSSLEELYRRYDYSVSYLGVCYSELSESASGNADCAANSLVVRNYNQKYLVSYFNGRYYSSNVDYSIPYYSSQSYPNLIVYSKERAKQYNDTRCFDPSLKLKNPFEGIFDPIYNLVVRILSFFLDFVESSLERIVEILFKILMLVYSRVSRIILKYLSVDFMNSLFCAFFVYVYFRDYILSLIVFFATSYVYWLIRNLFSHMH